MTWLNCQQNIFWSEQWRKVSPPGKDFAAAEGAHAKVEQLDPQKYQDDPDSIGDKDATHWRPGSGVAVSS